MMILGIDYGDQNIGLALAEEKSIAVPYKIIKNNNLNQVLLELKEIIKEENIELLIIGMPYSLKGNENERTDITKEFISFLKNNLEIKIKIINEQFTSKLYIKMGLKDNLDKHSATAILDTYLEQNK